MSQKSRPEIRSQSPFDVMQVFLLSNVVQTAARSVLRATQAADSLRSTIAASQTHSNRRGLEHEFT